MQDNKEKKQTTNKENDMLLNKNITFIGHKVAQKEIYSVLHWLILNNQ